MSGISGRWFTCPLAKIIRHPFCHPDMYSSHPTSPPMSQAQNGAAGSYPHDGYGQEAYSDGYSQNAYQDGYGQDGYSGDYSYGSQQPHQQPYSDAPAPVWGSGYTGAAAAAAAPSMHSHSGSAGGASQWDGSHRHSIGGPSSSHQPYSDHPPSSPHDGPMRRTSLQSAAASKAAEAAGMYRSDGGPPRHSRQLSNHSGVLVHQDGGRPMPPTASTSAEGGSSEELPPPSYQ